MVDNWACMVVGERFSKEFTLKFKSYIHLLTKCILYHYFTSCVIAHNPFPEMNLYSQSNHNYLCFDQH